MVKKLGWDTMCIIDCTQNNSSGDHIHHRYGREFQFVLSSRAKGEAIFKLEKSFGYSNSEAINEVERVISSLRIIVERKDSNDDKEGDKLTQKHTECHYPDSTIIAHYKRLRVHATLSRDDSFKSVCKKEGIRTFHMPTQSSIINRRVRGLFRHYHQRR